LRALLLSGISQTICFDAVPHSFAKTTRGGLAFFKSKSLPSPSPLLNFLGFVLPSEIALEEVSRLE
jgi:hypothetical protein